MTGDIERAEDETATLYEYHGPGASSDIVSRVKSHHSEVTDTEYSRLSARKIARGGRRNRVTTVVVVGPSTTETDRDHGGEKTDGA